MKKYLPLVAVTIVLLTTSFAVVNLLNKIGQEKTATQTQPQNTTGSVTLVLKYGDDEIATYSGNLKEGMTALSLLADTADREAIIIEVKEYDFGTMVESIGGRKNGTERAWIYFVNEVSGEVAADKKTLKGGDSVQWKYIKPGY